MVRQGYPDNMLTSLAKLAISIARKMGALIFLVPEGKWQMEEREVTNLFRHCRRSPPFGES